jgi:6-phosphogluconolactonase
VGREAAEAVRAAAGNAIAERGLFLLVLSGGSTPRVLYRLLGSPPYLSSIDWMKVHLFWADERCVPPDHEDSNFRLVNDAFLADAPVPAGQVHRIRGEEGAESAARSYDAELQAFFRGGDPVFDLVLLGVGEDGHTASLFPGDAMAGTTGPFAVPVVRPSGPGRVSLTLAVLNRARQVLFLATGARKAQIVAAVLQGSNAAAYPAGLVHPAGGALWLLDRDAAGARKGGS